MSRVTQGINDMSGSGSPPFLFRSCLLPRTSFPQVGELSVPHPFAFYVVSWPRCTLQGLAHDLETDCCLRCPIRVRSAD